MHIRTATQQALAWSQHQLEIQTPFSRAAGEGAPPCAQERSEREPEVMWFAKRLPLCEGG